MTQLGVCDYCEEEAIVVVNDTRACTEHLDNAMAVTLGPVREVLLEHWPETE